MDTLQEWKKIMIALPDKAFFPTVRNYLGEIQTPFHKPDLIEQLSNFLSKESSVERILSYIDENDAAILSACDLLEAAEPQALQLLLSDRFTFLELHHRLLNLEERLLIYRDGDTSIRLSPLFRERLKTHCISQAILFPSLPAPPKPELEPWPNDRLLAALLSFSEEYQGVLTKNDGKLRKKVIDDAGQRFPQLSPDRLLLFIRAMKLMGLDEKRNKSAISRLEELSASERAGLYQGAVAAAADGLERVSKKECVHLGEKALLFWKHLSPGRVYPENSLVKLFEAVSIKQGLNAHEAPRYPGLLEISGLLQKSDKGYRRSAPPPQGDSAGTVDPKRMIIIQPDYSITVGPELDFKLLVRLSAFLEIKRYDHYCHYELHRDSFHRGCITYGPRSLLDLLENHEIPLPQNISTTLSEWAEEFNSVTLTRGIILNIGEERRHLVEHSPETAPYLEAQPAPGVYILDPDKESQWRKALENAGIRPLPPVQGFSPEQAGGKEESAPWPKPRIAEEEGIQETTTQNRERLHPEQSSKALQQELSRLLEEKKLDKEDYEDLAARIEKKLILFPEQLIPGIGEKEKHEAKGLDYTGKVRLIERAISEGNALLELVERTRGGSPRRLLLKPQELRKTGTDLLLTGRKLPEEEHTTVTVRRISLVRKLKSSLFAPDQRDTRRR